MLLRKEASCDGGGLPACLKHLTVFVLLPSGRPLGLRGTSRGKDGLFQGS